MSKLLEKYYVKEQEMFDKINNRFALESEMKETLQEIAEKHQKKLKNIDVDDFGSEVYVHQLKEARDHELMKAELDYTKRLLKNEQQTAGLLDQMNDMQLPIFEMYAGEYEKFNVAKQEIINKYDEQINDVFVRENLDLFRQYEQADVFELDQDDPNILKVKEGSELDNELNKIWEWQDIEIKNLREKWLNRDEELAV